MRRWFLCAAAIAVSSFARAHAAEPVPADDPPRIMVVAKDDQGRILAEWDTPADGKWHNIVSYGSPLDWLILLPPGPNAQPLTVGEKTYFLTDTFCLAKPPNADRSPWCDEPRGSLYSATFNSGEQIVLRFPEGTVVADSVARLGSETQPLLPFSPLEYAAMLLAGWPLSDQEAHLQSADAESWLTAADCRSLVAFSSGQGRAEALRFAGEAVTRLLGEFAKQRQHYPASLDQLWQGAGAIQQIGPANPYAWPAPLCLPAPPPDGQPGLLYIPLRDADQPQSAPSGYLLGVQDSGMPAAPPAGLPFAGMLPPAVQWFYQPAAEPAKTAVALDLPAATKVKLHVLDPQGAVVYSQTFKMTGGALSFGSCPAGDSPLRFNPAVPPQDTSSLICAGKECIAENVEPTMTFSCGYTLFVKRGDGFQTLGYDEPGQQLWCATLPDGTRGVLRLPENYAVGSGTLTVGGQTAPLQPFSAVEYAALQLAGAPPPDPAAARKEWSLTNWVAAADTQSLAASASGQGRAAALQFAGEAVAHMLDEYFKQHQAYPTSLDQLWQGADAVAPISPGNPYAWPAPLCSDNPANATHGLVYLPIQWTQHPDPGVGGYFLGVVDDGPAAPLPPGMKVSGDGPGVVRWFTPPPK
jgi:type II secretory pathway pseudopilin PulG